MSSEIVTIRSFFTLLYDAVAHMEMYPELTAKKTILSKNISKGMSLYISRGMTLDDNVTDLIQYNDKCIMQLAWFLVFGLKVDQGVEYSIAYEDTIAKYDNMVEKFLTKILIKPKFFRKLNDYEREQLQIIQVIINDHENKC